MLGQRIWAVVALVVAGVLPSLARAQWSSQSIPLRPGWNAVFLQVQPADDTCEAVFAGVPVETVWAWNRRDSPVRYVQDADGLSPGQPEWLTYTPQRAGGAAATNLFAVHGGRAYLVKLGGAQEVTLHLSGRPVIRAPTWVPDSFNLVGFQLAPEAPPTVAAFLAPSAAHRDHRLHRLTAAGKWERVANPAATALRAGEAVWVYCTGPSDYEAPLSVGFEQAGGLDFGRMVGETTLTLANHTAAEKTVTLRPSPSASPPTEASPFLAGPVPLSYYRIDGEHIGWVPVDGPLAVTVPAGSERPVRLAVRRADMAVFAPAAGATARSGVLYASLLEIADEDGVSFTVPVSSEGLTAYTKSAGGELKGDDPRVGLWVGYATIDYVSSPGQTAAEPAPPAGRQHAANIPSGSEFGFRLIVHVDEALQARLVQQVTLVFQPGTYGPDPVNADLSTVTSAGRSVLITDDALLSQYSGAGLRDGQEVGRRIGTAAYAFPASGGTRPYVLEMAGAFADQLACSWTLPANDPLSPFLHLYHPDHKAPGADYAVTRAVALAFVAGAGGSGAAVPALGQAAGGFYRETLSGLHRTPLAVEGGFVLYRVNTVGSLNH